MSTYSSRLRAKLNPKHPSNVSFPNTQPNFWVLDRIAEEQYNQKLLGGFNPRNICTKCNTALPKTNVCDYC